VRKLFGLDAGGGVWYPEVLWWSLLLIAAGHAVGVMLERGDNVRGWFEMILSHLSIRRMANPISGIWPVFEMKTLAGTFVAAVALLSIYFFGAANASPFIYFQF
jgi:hypothetical protein